MKNEEEIEFKYEGAVPDNELISYKNMMIEMNRSAITDGSCFSLLVMGFATFMAILVMSIIINMIR